jgi:hypothetical protein
MILFTTTWDVSIYTVLPQNSTSYVEIKYLFLTFDIVRQPSVSAICETLKTPGITETENKKRDFKNNTQ